MTAAGLYAQQPVFRTGIDLVQVDVVALDKDGHIVRGLTAADFTLLDRKKPQTIATFEEVTHDRVAAAAPPPALHLPGVALDVATNLIPPAERMVVMVLDDLHVYQGRTETARGIGRKVVNAIGAGSSMAILFTSGRGNTEFTRDLSALLAAVDTFTGLPKVRRPNSGMDQMTSRGGMDDSVPNKSATVNAGGGSTGWTAGGADDDSSLQHFFDDMTLYKTLEQSARLLASVDSRRKAFVLVTEGNAHDMKEMFKSETTPCEMRSPMAPCYHQVSSLQMMEQMQKASVATYIFDPRGFVSDQAVNLECAPGKPRVVVDPCVGQVPGSDHNWVRQAQHGLEITAAASGGFAVTNTNDFDAGVSRLVDEIDHYYLLGFYPSDPKGNGFRPIDVKVNRPGLTLHFRQGYEAGPKKPEKTNADPLVAMSSGVLPKTDLPLRLAAVPVSVTPGVAGRKAEARVVAVIEARLPRRDVTSANQKLSGELRYVVMAVNVEDGKVVRQMTNTASFSSERPPGRAVGETFAVQMPIELSLQPGRYQLRASVLAQALNKGGSVFQALDVPDVSSTPLALGGLVVGYADGARAPLAIHRGAAPILPFAPSLDREFTATDSLRVYCPIVRSREAPIRATVEILDGNDRHVGAAEPHVAASAVEALLPLAGIQPGLYKLRVTVTGGSRTVTREIPFAIK